MEISRHNKSALLLGATELVGRKCIVELLKNPAYTKIVLFLEEPLAFDHPKLEKHLVSFEKLEKYKQWMAVDDVFYCWGTQMKLKYNPSQFDPTHTYAFELAKLTYEAGAHQFVLLSSIAADPNSVLYYRQERVEVEQVIRETPFWAVHIFRPAILLEDDENSKSVRWMKTIASRINQLAGGGLSKYKPVSAVVVADAMVKAAQRFQAGIHIYSNEYLEEYSNTTEKALIKRDGKSR